MMMEHSPVVACLWLSGPKVDHLMMRMTDGWQEIGCIHSMKRFVFLKSVMEHQKGVADNHQSLGKVLIGPWTLIMNVLTLI